MQRAINRTSYTYHCQWVKGDMCADSVHLDLEPMTQQSHLSLSEVFDLLTTGST